MLVSGRVSVDRLQLSAGWMLALLFRPVSLKHYRTDGTFEWFNFVRITRKPIADAKVSLTHKRATAKRLWITLAEKSTANQLYANCDFKLMVNSNHCVWISGWNVDYPAKATRPMRWKLHGGNPFLQPFWLIHVTQFDKHKQADGRAHRPLGAKTM